MIASRGSQTDKYVTEVSARVAGLFLCVPLPKPRNAKFCVQWKDFENSVIKTGASTRSSFKGVLYPKEFFFNIKQLCGTVLVPRLKELRSLTSKMSFSL